MEVKYYVELPDYFGVESPVEYTLAIPEEDLKGNYGVQRKAIIRRKVREAFEQDFGLRFEFDNIYGEEVSGRVF